MENGGAARQDFHIAAVVKIVDAEGAFAAGLDSEIATGHTEIISGRGIDVEGSRTLAKDKTRGACSILKRKIVKLKNCVLVKKGHCAIFEFDFGTAAIVRGKNIALADRQVCLRSFPYGFLIRERVTMSFPSEAHITLDET